MMMKRVINAMKLPVSTTALLADQARYYFPIVLHSEVPLTARGRGYLETFRRDGFLRVDGRFGEIAQYI